MLARAKVRLTALSLEYQLVCENHYMVIPSLEGVIHLSVNCDFAPNIYCSDCAEKPNSVSFILDKLTRARLHIITSIQVLPFLY